MHRFKHLLIFAVVAIASQQHPFLFGDDPPSQTRPEKGPAYTEPPQDDLNYALMGEFVGTIKTKGKGGQLLGLQIRPIADDRFDAVAFYGGVPGQTKHQPEPMQLIGKRSGELLVLSGGPWAIFVDKNSCKLIDQKGQQVGRLKRIKRRSPTLHSPPPTGSTVLFDGTNTEQFTNGSITYDGLLMEGADLKPMFQDFNLHVEFRLPYMPEADGQKRGNSGLYLQSRYECQVLDSFGTTPMINGCGALYQFRAPDFNMCFPPLVWQTYDVQFTAPRWAADGSKIRDAHVTSWINGVKVQDNIALPNKTGAGKPEEPVLLPIRLQNHGDPVRYRNIWIVDRGLATGPFPVVPTKEEIKTAVTAEQQRKRERAKAARQRAQAAKKKAAAEKKAAESNPVDQSKPEKASTAADDDKTANQPDPAGDKKPAPKPKKNKSD